MILNHGCVRNVTTCTIHSKSMMDRHIHHTVVALAALAAVHIIHTVHLTTASQI